MDARYIVGDERLERVTVQMIDARNSPEEKLLRIWRKVFNASANDDDVMMVLCGIRVLSVLQTN